VEDLGKIWGLEVVKGRIGEVQNLLEGNIHSPSLLDKGFKNALTLSISSLKKRIEGREQKR